MTASVDWFLSLVNACFTWFARLLFTPPLTPAHGWLLPVAASSPARRATAPPTGRAGVSQDWRRS
jgi:hypothetical protein